MTIYIYSGIGTNKHCIKRLFNELKNYQVKKISLSKILKNNWQKDALAFVIGGGRDVFYAKKLHGVQTDLIYDYVKNGGSYLGICAGAYFGSSYVEFDKNQKLEVLGKRELSFFKGKAIGPAFGPNTFKYKSQFGARGAMISFKPLEKCFRACHNGGCYFEEDKLDNDIEVIARYEEIENKPAAIIKCKVGKGVAILSGVHFEFDSSSIFSSLDLKQYENDRQSLFKYLLKELINA